MLEERFSYFANFPWDFKNSQWTIFQQKKICFMHLLEGHTEVVSLSGGNLQLVISHK